MNKYFLLILVLGLKAVDAKVVTFTACSDAIKEVRVDVCKAEPCEFKRGSSGEVDIDFVAPADSKTLTAKLTINIGGLDVPHPSFDADGCNDHGISCPIKKGTKYTYKYQMTVMPEYPKIKSTMKWVLTDDAGNQDICFTLPVSIVD